MPLILAFDTATDRATSALVGDGEVLGERVSRASTLLADVDALVRQAGAHPRDVDRARGRDRAGKLHRDPDRARRGTRARARSRRDRGGRLDPRRARRRRARRDPGDRREAPRGLRAGAAGASRRPSSSSSPDATYVGDGAVRYRDVFEQAGAVVPPDDDERHLPRARFHAELATGFGPVELVEPLYVRLPDAVEVAR